MKKYFLGSIVLTCLGACAQIQTSENGATPTQKEYRTGSNLPIGERDKSGVSIADREAAQGLVRPAGMPRPTGPGN